MRLSLAVNGHHKVLASLNAKGWLNAHVNVSHEVESSSDNRVWLHAIDTSNEPNTTHSYWGDLPIGFGDKVEIEILGDGESDTPIKISRTTDNPNNLFSNAAQARQLLDSVKSCDLALHGILDRAKDAEPEEEYKKLALAVGSVLVELDRQLLSPTLRRHPDLQQVAEVMNLR
jgi:hypothetical protein